MVVLSLDSAVCAYSEHIVRRPATVLASVLVSSVLLVFAALRIGVIPDFGAADSGWEPRGTELAGRIFGSVLSLETAQCASLISALPNVSSHHTFAHLKAFQHPFPDCAVPGGCTNVCKFALDGECDEMSSNWRERPRCARGTDCDDCNLLSSSVSPSQPLYTEPEAPAHPPPRPMLPSSPFPLAPIGPTAPSQLPLFGEGCAEWCTGGCCGFTKPAEQCAGCDERVACHRGAECWKELDQSDCNGCSSGHTRAAGDSERRLQPRPDGEDVELQTVEEAAAEKGMTSGMGAAYREERLVDYKEEGLVDMLCSTSPSRAAELVFSSEGSGSLLRAAPLRAICHIGEELRRLEAVAHSLSLKGGQCMRWSSREECCPSHSPGQLAATLAGQESCAALTEEDVTAYVSRLEQCAPLYRAGVLTRDGMVDQMSMRVTYNETAVMTDPDSCLFGNIAFESLDALLDETFVTHLGTSAPSELRLAKLIVPTSDRRACAAMHDALRTEGASHGGVMLVAYSLGNLKMDLFTRTLLHEDMPIVAVAALAILLTIVWYSGSMLFGLFAFVELALAVFLAYGIYVAVLRLPFFPTLNLTGIFICIGIGADDIFIYLQAFDDALHDRAHEHAWHIDGGFMTQVLRDAGMATLVTSLTTAAAFFSLAASPITAVRCFGVYCALVVVRGLRV